LLKIIEHEWKHLCDPLSNFINVTIHLLSDNIKILKNFLLLQNLVFADRRNITLFIQFFLNHIVPVVTWNQFQPDMLLFKLVHFVYFHTDSGSNQYRRQIGKRNNNEISQCDCLFCKVLWYTTFRRYFLQFNDIKTIKIVK